MREGRGSRRHPPSPFLPRRRSYLDVRRSSVLEPALPIPNPTTLLNPGGIAIPHLPFGRRGAPATPAAASVERARETLPPCPQSAYASRVAPATSAWGWPPPPPCSTAPFTASPPPRSFSSDASSALFFPPSFLIPVFGLSSIFPRAPSLSRPTLLLRLGPTLVGLYPSTLVSTSSRLESATERESEEERKRQRDGMEGWSRRKRNEERNGTAPLEANRINVSRIIHAYFRATRGNVLDRVNFSNDNCKKKRKKMGTWKPNL